MVELVDFRAFFSSLCRTYSLTLSSTFFLMLSNISVETVDSLEKFPRFLILFRKLFQELLGRVSSRASRVVLDLSEEYVVLCLRIFGSLPILAFSIRCFSDKFTSVLLKIP